MSQQKKQGGNGKSSAPSSVAYWARAKMMGFAATHSTRRIARHKARMAKKMAHRAAYDLRKSGVRGLRAA
jgi:hypothetical protein